MTARPHPDVLFYLAFLYGLWLAVHDYLRLKMGDLP